MKKNRWPFILAMFVVFALSLAACSARANVINVEMNEFKFIPDTFTAHAGKPVTMNLKNTGALEHDLDIMVLGKDASIPFNDDDKPNIFWERKVPPQETVAVEFIAPQEPGEYQVVCGTAGHLEQGMKATLTVLP